MILLQIILYLAIYIGLITFSLRKGAINALYFYPKLVQERSFTIGLAEREDIRRKKGGSLLVSAGASMHIDTVN